MRKLLTFALLAMLGFASGCSTTPKVDWNSRVGSYTHDAAIKELGVPDRSATLTDGTVVAEWLRSRGTSYSTFTGYPGTPYMTYDTSRFPDRYLRLTFGPDGKLTGVEKFAK